MKTFFSLCLVALIGVATLAFQPNVSLDGDGANVVRDFSCGISLVPLGVFASVSTSDTHTTTTPSGNTQFKCTADLPDGVAPPSKRLLVRDIGCLTLDGYTATSRNSYTPSGKVELICTINGSTQ